MCSRYQQDNEKFLFNMLEDLQIFESFQITILSKSSNVLSMKYDANAQTKLDFFATHAILTLLLKHPK